MMANVDPVTLQVLAHACYSVSDEMVAAMVRTAYSTNIKDRRDCSAGLFTPAGELFAQAAIGTPLHLGVLPFSVRTLLERIPTESMAPGVDYIVNSPYPSGPGHLNDVTIESPVYWGDKLVAVLANAAHHVDVGGGAPGSMPFGVTEIFQEGLQIPPLPIARDGVLEESLIALILENVRTAREFRGDLMAQIAANHVGKRRLGEVLNRYGRDAMSLYIPALLDHSERRLRAELSSLPDGRWMFEDYLEGDSIHDRRICIRAAVEISGDEITADFSETDDQVDGPLNCRPPSAIACVYYVVKCITDPDLRPNDGLNRPVNVITRPGSLLHAEYPAAVCNANIITTQRIVDVLLGALAKALPDRVSAACSGTMNLLNIGGRDPRTGDLFNYIETYGGGQGALHDRDGASGVHSHMTNTRNASIEQIELAHPLFVERYSLVPDSEGPGTYRGGFGLVREFEVLSETTTLTLSSDRHEIGPWGLFGGGDGRTSECQVINPDGVAEPLQSKVTRPIASGARLISSTPGGGGWGDPYLRSPDAVLRDVRDGLVSLERARTEYGVAIDVDAMVVDEAVTAQTREDVPRASRSVEHAGP